MVALSETLQISQAFAAAQDPQLGQQQQLPCTVFKRLGYGLIRQQL
jgi:hypothetical protein